MSALSLSAALIGLSAQCAATVAPGTLLTFARAESGLDPLALHDNTSGASPRAETKAEAISLASALIGAGHSVDLGLMQVNSRHLTWLGLSITDAFELCPSMAAGARVLHTAYDPCVDAGGEAQSCLRVAASAYNTGSPTRGFENGYVRRIADTARHVIPAIRFADVLGQLPAPVPAASSTSPTVPAPPPPPPLVVVRPATAGRDLVFPQTK